MCGCFRHRKNPVGIGIQCLVQEGPPMWYSVDLNSGLSSVADGRYSTMVLVRVHRGGFFFSLK